MMAAKKSFITVAHGHRYVGIENVYMVNEKLLGQSFLYT